MATSSERDSKIIALRCGPLQLSWSAGDEGEGGKWKRMRQALVGDDEKKSAPKESVGR